MIFLPRRRAPMSSSLWLLLLLLLLAACGGAPGQAPPAGEPEPARQRLGVQIEGEGRVQSEPADLDCPARCEAEFAQGSTLVLRASAAEGFRFAGYAGDCQGESCTLRMDRDRQVQARFEALPPALVLSETDGELSASDPLTGTVFVIAKQTGHYRIQRGERVLESVGSGLALPLNLDYYGCDDIQDGIDRCYPGLVDVSYQPLAYRTAAGWQAASGASLREAGRRELWLDLATSDGAGAELRVGFAEDGALELDYRPKAADVQAVADAWAAGIGPGYYGAGQRFGRYNLRGLSVPLWISHGLGSDRSLLSTNEVVAPFFWSSAGWGLWSAQDERGEFNFANPLERADAVQVLREAASLHHVFYLGTPQEILSAHTARAGRPRWRPAEWMWRPMIWQDEDTSSESVLALVEGMSSRDIPLGAVWLDNPWDAGRASFEFSAERFPDPAALIDAVHAAGVKLMVWLSPYVGGAAEAYARERGWVVSGTREDGNDATYFPTRGIDPALDFTHPEAFAWWRDGLRGLIARGIDGVKLDRCEEDLSDTSVWANGLPNRANHNPYCVLYQRAAWEAFAAERPANAEGVSDYALLARGGWTGSARYTGHWAADNLSLPGLLGLGQALNSLLSLSASGFPWSGADIGGYVGLRQDMGEGAAGNPLLLPTPNLYIRWTQLGALSPVMQSAIPPWWVSDAAIDNYRRYATLHDRLAPLTAELARASIEQGVPIVRPMAYAYPDDAQALLAEDQYLYGPDLLVAPITGELVDLGLAIRTVYLPAGRWRHFWNGIEFDGPLTVPVVAALDELPLFVRVGAALPAGVSAAELP